MKSIPEDLATKQDTIMGEPYYSGSSFKLAI